MENLDRFLRQKGCFTKMNLAELNIDSLSTPDDDPCVADFIRAPKHVEGRSKWIQNHGCVAMGAE